MAEKCPFNQCQMAKDITDLSGVCDKDDFGGVCAPVAGYGSLVFQFDRLKDAFELPIQAIFTLTQTPGGYPPEDIRQQWVGVEIPVRHPKIAETGRILVSPTEAFLCLMRAGKLDAANWFLQNGLELGALGANWKFQKSDGKLNMLPEPTDTSDFYGAVISDTTRVAIDQEAQELVDKDSILPSLETQAKIRQLEESIDGVTDFVAEGYVLDLAIELLISGAISSMSTLERWLRSMESSAYIIAVPLDENDRMDYANFEGFATGIPNFFVRITNDTTDYYEWLTELGVSTEENLERLREADIPVIIYDGING